jgi:monovalent cation:H+ antiporter-2, CPA2 family
VIIAGFGQFGATVGRLLRANDVPITVLEIDSDRVDLSRRLGLKVYYGDATRHDLLAIAGAAQARLLVIAVDSPERTLDLVQTAKKHFPHLTVLARAFEWPDAHALYAAGVEHVYREDLDTALRTGTEALHMLGFRAYAAQRAAQTFLRHDTRSMRELTLVREDRSVYISAARERIAALEQMMRADREEATTQRDSGWDAESLRNEYGPVVATNGQVDK